MSRIKIDLPDQFNFTTSIPIRITDINYGGHTGNDTILSIIHEARIQFLQSKGFSEMDFAGAGMIMSDVGIEFKSELFYGDIVMASVTVANITKVSFDVYYKLEKEAGDKKVSVAFAKTGMVCYDYKARKIAAVPQEARDRLTSL
jgi:acyl-CoA thioesterase FadM